MHPESAVFIGDLNEAGEPSAGTYDVYEYDDAGEAVTETQVSFQS